MGWDEVQKVVPEFEQVMTDLGISIPPSSPTAPQFACVKEFLHDQRTMSQDNLNAKWTNKFKEVYDAVIVVNRIARAAVALQDQPRKRLKETLKTVFAGSLTQDFVEDPAKDFFYELELAYLLIKAGFTVTLREPDVVVTGKGLSQPIGLACKYPSSRKQVHGHISKGYTQLTGQKLNGVVAFGMDLLIFQEAFSEPPHYLDFTQNPKNPVTIAQEQLDMEMVSLVAERPVKFPSELPLDGALLSIGMWGRYGTPAGIAEVGAWTLQCDASNSLFKDITVLVTTLAATFPRPRT